MPNEDRNRIEELKKSLYSRTTPDVRTRRKLRFSDAATDMQRGWERPAEESPEVKLTEKYKDHSMSFFIKILIGSIIFCIVTVGIGAYIFFEGGNFISADNIDIAIRGPVSVPGGAPVSFDITVTNNNNIDLKLADMEVIFPEGVTKPSDPTQELSSYRELIGDIPSGGSATKKVEAIIFGEENTQKHFTVSITYNVKGSAASFTKEKTHDILINSSPVNLTMSSFNEITSGQEFDLTINVTSNSQNTLKNTLVTAGYPFGFTFLSSDPEPLPGNTAWRIGDIPPGGKRAIVVHGKLQGEDEDMRVFQASIGAHSLRNTNIIGTEYMSVEQEVAIRKPFMTVAISLDNDETTDDMIGYFNKPVRVEVSWFNNLSTAVSNAEIVLKLSGSAYDKSFVQPGEGHFRSLTDDIAWNQQTTPRLASVGAGEGGSVSFTITPRDLGVAGKPVVNPTLSFSANVSGRRTQESGVPETLTATVARNERISSLVSLSGQVVRSIGPFVNTGPIPPKAEQKTTYTIMWTVDNTVNTIDNARVTATLPPGVSWLNQVNPATESVSFDSRSGMITWDVGSVGTHTLQTGQRRAAAFQVSLEPSVSQVNNIPILVNDATLTGTDSFTGETVTSAQSFLTTRFSTDPTYREGYETVGR